MTESSSHSPSTARTIISPRNNLENDIIDITSSIDIQSQRISSLDTNIDSSLAVSNPYYFLLFPFIFLIYHSSSHIKIR